MNPNFRTDSCGTPFPYSCGVQFQMDYPTCYTTAVVPCPQPGFRRITIEPDCSVSAIELLDEERQTVIGGTEVICNPRSSQPGQRVVP